MYHVSTRKKKVHQRILPTKQKDCFNTRAEAPTLFRFSDLEEANKQRENFSQVEEALSLWITNALSANLIINGDILRENFLHSNLKLPGFQLLMDGWINLKNVTI